MGPIRYVHLPTIILLRQCIVFEGVRILRTLYCSFIYFTPRSGWLQRKSINILKALGATTIQAGAKIGRARVRSRGGTVKHKFPIRGNCSCCHIAASCCRCCGSECSHPRIHSVLFLLITLKWNYRT